MHTGARKAAPTALELTRCGLLGDIVSCGVVAWLLQHLFHAEGYLDRVRTVEEMRAPARGDPVVRVPTEHLPLRLAQAHIAQADPRGSDVRVDTGEVSDTRSWPRRPIDVDRWKWRTEWVTSWQEAEHITFLEVLAGHLSLVWRTSKRKESRKSFLHLIDNRAALAALAKSRSSSRRLQRVVRRGAALLLAAGMRRALGYAETDRNPADAGSRRVHV